MVITIKKCRSHKKAASLYHAARDIPTYHITHNGKLRSHTTRLNMSPCDLFIHDMSQLYYIVNFILCQ